MTSLTRLEEAFRRVADQGVSTGEYRAIPISDTLQMPPLAAIDAQGRRHLLIAVEANAAVLTDERSAGIKLRRQELVVDSASLWFLDIASGGDRYNDLFTIVADEILTSWMGSNERPDRVALVTLDRWRDLISRMPLGRALTLSELTGLVGEMLVLEMVRNRVDLWDGPNGGRHDFVGEVADLEVKSSLTRAGYEVEIHSLEQLAPPPDGRLALVYLRMESVSSGGTSLGELVDAVPDAVRQAVLDRLASVSAVGELVDPMPRRFRLLERQVYVVGDGFPRLTTVDLAHWPIHGVKYLHYGIDLTAAAGPLSEAEADALFLEIAGS